MTFVRSTELPGVAKHVTGKVRDVYDLGDSLLLVASDRLSAFDVVLPGGIPDKGKVLTQISLFWFDKTRDIVENHLITANADEIVVRLADAGVPDAASHRETIRGRSILGRKAEQIPIECIVRGYLAGSAWKEYKELLAGNNGDRSCVSLHGIRLPVDMVESAQLPEPVFTPSTKASSGHDENISVDQARNIVGKEIVDELQRLSLEIYTKASEYARTRGIIIADTKFEFGILDEKIILIDEILTPDSSRFWAVDDYQPGRSQDSFDKQFVRDYLLTLDWDKTYPGPELPEEIVRKTSERYKEAYLRLTGHKLPEG
ncbi:MAG TPA: phosphoribosylaminoimidazolesuccinocarboxamide synthase [Armatimonadota bacterium]|nr:phosphoribosylaminoimidazolesuccinocarboxamide synthase [Armatimonadota bacterium]HOM72204.1 phosphoribosylaminoimidazolesuccinocarboxamide synthase [Armatimonadota bacterium]